MTNPNSTPANTTEVAPVAIVYAVTDKGRAHNVTVSKNGAFFAAYQCDCKDFPLWGECKHCEAVAAQRKAEGRTH